jgi:SAM-dependent methyltransferase
VELGAATEYCDVGCASGVAAFMAAQRRAGLRPDAADALIEIARARVPSANFHVGEMEALPFGDCTFDVVTGFHAFNCARGQSSRLLKPGALPNATVHRYDDVGSARRHGCRSTDRR